MIRNIIRHIGFDVVRYPPLHSHSGRMRRLFDHYEFDFVIDVGANQGQFGQFLRQFGYSGHILSFEPLSTAHKTLLDNSRGDDRWMVAPRMALGRSVGNAVINVAANLESSSILPMSKLHSDAAPTSHYTSQESVPVSTLDLVVRQHLPNRKAAMLKIDTQGFELEVLAGADTVLQLITGVQMEMSLAKLYDGQPGYLELIDYMTARRFSLVDLVPGFTDPKTGHLLQVDGVFIRQ
jgi:FkbM family methyltransferase